MEKEEKSIDEICGTSYVKVQTGEEKDSMNQVAIQYLKEIQKSQIMDQPEKLPKAESEIQRFQSNKWLLVNPITLKPTSYTLNSIKEETHQLPYRQ